MGDIEKAGIDNPAFELSNDAAAAATKDHPDKLEKGTGEEPERATWGNGIEFLMSCIAMSVGLGNIWRFPFTAYENGGGAFLIPYIIVLTVIGRPLYYMEMALGQFSNKGNVRFYKSLSPFMKGVGFGQVLGSICVATYYCSLMAITLYYFVNSFTNDLPWGHCKPEWENCLPATQKADENFNITGLKSSSELYFTREVLKETNDISDGIGLPEWRLTLGLLASWLITLGISVRGVKSSGKASYFLALFPYVIMITLLIRASTLEGASEGMYYFVKTDWSKLAEPDVWYAAVTQCFFSLNTGFGSIIMFSSYNDFEHNINRDALIVTTLDTFTSLLSGTTIFGILGNLAYNLGVSPDEVISSGGTGLAFISYPDAIAKMDAVPWLFAILFFFMLFVLGVGSLVALHGTANTVVQDLFPRTPTWIIASCTAITGFLLGLMYVTPGGQFMLNLVDYFGGTFIIYVFVIVEITGVVWFYGLNNFALDMEFMLKRKVGIYWRLTWGFITPVLLIIIFIYFCIKFERPVYNNNPYPDGILAFGWCILGLGVAQFLYWIGLSIYKHRHLGYKAAVYKTFGNDDWGPTGTARREAWKEFKRNAELTRPRSSNRFQRWLRILVGLE